MASAPDLIFPPFRLDLEHEQLWRGPDQVPLRPKTFAVLHYLVTHAPRLVTQAELLHAVWADTYVSEGLLRGYMHELRIVLGDAAQVPRFIETVPRRGWRFLAPVTTASHPADPPPSHTPCATAASVPRPLSHVSPLVGREVELAQLHGWLARALGGERQVVFVTGEPGMGKTALVDTFLAQALAQGELGIALGQCVEHYGVGEAYLPVLEALGRLCRGAAGDQLLRLLRRYAPTWLAQMPALLEATECEALQPQVHGATQERMVRELAEAVEVLTTVQPLVLWLEDVHWSDYSTLDLLAGLAHRREPARLLVLGTYRPAEVLAHRHPLRGLTQDLQVHRQCVEVPLRLLTVAEVTQYLEARFAIRAQDAAPFHALGQTLHQGTDGNPLFMVLVVDALVAQGAIAAVAGQW